MVKEPYQALVYFFSRYSNQPIYGFGISQPVLFLGTGFVGIFIVTNRIILWRKKRKFEYGEYQKVFVKNQYQLRKNAWCWYILPILVGPFLLVAEKAVVEGASGYNVAALFLIAFLGLYLGYFNRKSAKEFKKTYLSEG